MANKENSTELSGRNEFADQFAGSSAVLNPLNGKRRASPPVSSNIGVSVSDDWAAKKQKMDAPTNIEELRKFFDDADRTKQFSFEQNKDDWNGLFEIHTVPDSTSYMSFHNDATIGQLQHSDCKIFFYNSDELLTQFQRIGVQFHGIEQILMVFVNHKIDRITPLGIFFLPDRSKPILDDVVRVISERLNDGAKTVTTCTTKYDVDLRNSISQVWPSAQLIGCSDEYRKAVKSFAKRNKEQSDQDKQATHLACNLTYLPQKYIALGVKIIEKRNASEYSANLVRYLRTDWTHLRSAFGEEIIHRSVKVCRHFMKLMIDKYFESQKKYTPPKVPVKHIVDFIGVLRTFARSQIFAMGLDGTVYENRRLRRFELNTEQQKLFEANIVTSFEDLRQCIEALQNDGTAIENAIENFMNKVA